MQINTKYNAGTSVWLMNDNKPFNGIIDVVDTATTTDGTNIQYSIRFISGYMKEEELFSTKEELIQSL